MGDYVTEGDGNGKKTSKTHAAELMIEKLKELPPVASCQTSIESSQLLNDLGPNYVYAYYQTFLLSQKCLKMAIHTCCHISLILFATTNVLLP